MPAKHRLTCRGLGFGLRYLYRADDNDDVKIIEAVKGTRLVVRSILSGMPYRYYVRVYNNAG